MLVLNGKIIIGALTSVDARTFEMELPRKGGLGTRIGHKCLLRKSSLGLDRWLTC